MKASYWQLWKIRLRKVRNGLRWAPRVRTPPTEEELDKSVEGILYVMAQCLTFYTWFSRFMPRQVNEGIDYQCFVITNSGVVESHLLFLRKLNEFFRTKPDVENEEKDNALAAYDFPNFKYVGKFLDGKEYTSMHERVAHITLAEVRSGKREWAPFELVKKARGRSQQFVTYLLDVFYTNDPLKKAYVTEYWRVQTEIFNEWKGRIEKEKRATPTT